MPRARLGGEPARRVRLRCQGPHGEDISCRRDRPDSSPACSAATTGRTLFMMTATTSDATSAAATGRIVTATVEVPGAGWPPILHLIERASWDAQFALAASTSPASLASEGFVHCTGDLGRSWWSPTRSTRTLPASSSCWRSTSALTSEVRWEAPAHPDGRLGRRRARCSPRLRSPRPRRRSSRPSRPARRGRQVHRLHDARRRQLSGEAALRRSGAYAPPEEILPVDQQHQGEQQRGRDLGDVALTERVRLGRQDHEIGSSPGCTSTRSVSDTGQRDRRRRCRHRSRRASTRRCRPRSSSMAAARSGRTPLVAHRRRRRPGRRCAPGRRWRRASSSRPTADRSAWSVGATSATDGRPSRRRHAGGRNVGTSSDRFSSRSMADVQSDIAAIAATSDRTADADRIGLLAEARSAGHHVDAPLSKVSVTEGTGPATRTGRRVGAAWR